MFKNKIKKGNEKLCHAKGGANNILGKYRWLITRGIINTVTYLINDHVEGIINTHVNGVTYSNVSDVQASNRIISQLLSGAARQ